MANNKIQLSDGTVLLDLSEDTVTSAAHIKNGLVGHLADGTTATGTLVEKDVKSVTYNLTGGATASISTSEVVTGQGFSVKLKAPAGYNLNGVTVTMDGVDITSQVFTPDEAGGGGGGANLQTKSVSYTPTTSAQSETVTPDSGYDGLEQVNVSVGAIPSEYIIPSGTKSITQNGTGIDVTQYASVDVAVSGGGSIGGLANMVDVNTQDYHLAYMLMAMKKGNTVGGTITYTTAFPNTETSILQTGLNELHGIMFVQTDGNASTAEENYQSNKFVLITINSDSSFNIFGLSMNSAGTWQRNRVQGTKYENAPINGALRFAGGVIYYTGRYNKNANYQLLRTNKTYEWIAW